MTKYALASCLLCCLLLPVSCDRASQYDPELEFDRMVDALVMMYVGEVQAVRLYEIGRQKETYAREYLYPAIFDSLGMSDSAFYRAYTWYERHPAALEVLMDSVSAGIQRIPLADSAEVSAHKKTLQELYLEGRHPERMQNGGKPDASGRQ